MNTHYQLEIHCLGASKADVVRWLEHTLALMQAEGWPDTTMAGGGGGGGGGGAVSFSIELKPSRPRS